MGNVCINTENATSQQEYAIKCTDCVHVDI